MPQNVAAILKRSGVIACIVGPILILINQGHAILALGEPLRWGPAMLTLIVPFLVATASALINAQSQPVVVPPPVDPETPVQSPPPAAQVTTAGPDMTDACETISEIRFNATNVNKTSIERVAFIADLITHFEDVNQHFATLSTDAGNTREVVDCVNESTDDITASMRALRANTASAVELMTAFLAVTRDFEVHCRSVRAASATLKDLGINIRLLSLNASVEAARSGDAGRGLSVIADEIRALAEKSTDDTQRIATVITALETSVAQLTSQIGTVEEKLSETQNQTENCYDKAESTSGEIRALGEKLCAFNSRIETQLPRVTDLIEGVTQIKNNTEAAVNGSAKNIALCDTAIQQLAPTVYVPTARAS